MAFNLATLAAELGIDPAVLAAKPDVTAKWDGYLGNADARYAEAERLKKDAETLQATIDANIASFGVNEATNIQLQAQVDALTAAAKTLEEKGGIKLNLNLPNIGTPAAKDPAKELTDLMTRGFSQIGATMAVSNRYASLFGKPMPDDPAKFGDEAAQARMSIADYAEKKYGFSAKEKEISDAAQKAHDDAIRTAAVKEYQDKYPSTAGHPELNGGYPSNYPAMPKPMEQKDFKSFSNMSTREKISAMVGRAQERTTQANQ